jgi:hypothetical protein
MKEAKKYTIKCKEEKCNKYYYARGLCRRHYKILLGKEGGYARTYQRKKDNPAYKKMKSESDKRYKDRLRSEGILSEYMHERYEAAKSDPNFLIRRRALNKKYYEKSKELLLVKNAAHQRRLRDELKFKVMNHYSNNDPKCANCGIDVISVLCIDHIKDNGAEHKRSLGKTNTKQIDPKAMYKDIIKRNFPPEFQVLCFNCNYHKEFIRRCEVYERNIEKAIEED